MLKTLKKTRVTPLSKADQALVEEMRAAEARGESALSMAFSQMSPKDKATSLRAHASRGCGSQPILR